MKYHSKNGVAVVLAGGLSQRLFPILDPKPLLEIQGESLLDRCLKRLQFFSKIYVCCNQKTALAIRRYRKEKGLKSLSFLIEPEARDTAAAVGWALQQIPQKKYQWIGIFSADQYFPESKSLRPFLKTVLSELNFHPEALFLAGSRAQTKEKESHSQFGWMTRSPRSRDKKDRSQKSFIVKEFIEKPSSSKLKKLYREKALINCGMFFGGLDTFRQAYQKHFPMALTGVKSFSRIPKQPIDRAIFEKWKPTRVLELDEVWEDLGTWQTLAKFQKTKPYFSNSKGRHFVAGDLKQEIFIFGDEGLALISSSNRILIGPISETKNLKSLINEAKKF